MEENLPQAVLGTVLKTGKLIETFIESRKDGGNETKGKKEESKEKGTETK
jgi:hypothetical protein